MKKVLFKVFVFLSLLSAIFVSCKKQEKSVEPLTLVMAEVNPESSVCGRMDAAFKEKVEELSKGLIKIDIRYSGSLGDEKNVIERMSKSDSFIDLSRCSANLSSIGEPKSAIISVPYTFANSAHFSKFAKSDVAQELLEEPYKLGLGVMGLCYAEEGFRSFFSTEPIEDITQIEGKKMRVSGGTLTQLAQALKAIPVNVAFTDLYMSLRTGEIEVAEQPLSNYVSNSFYEVAPYVILDRHMVGAVQILINAQTWDKLTQSQQKIMKEAADYASDYCLNIADDEDKTAIDKLVFMGITVTDVLDNEPWQNACQKMIEDSSKNYADLYKKIVDLVR